MHSVDGERMTHAAHDHDRPLRDAMLTEPGPGAFEALSETVHVMENDPATDWARVDLAVFVLIRSKWMDW
ncbi:hypothetical protein AN189_06355 [Loktanella sp. 3ANDIMAR09]|nr:hypothetical protein AN189_06355 [Loktanella sp. 3ANDIMAR09]